MTEQITIMPKSKIVYKGIFDLEKMYLKLIEWLEIEGFSTPHEKVYVERIKPNGKALEIIWESNLKKGDYFKYQLEITFHGIGVKDAEIDKPEGGKLALDNGEIQVIFKADLILNAKGDYEDNSVWNSLYKRYFIKKEIEEAKIELYKTSMDLIEETKNFLNLYKF